MDQRWLEARVEVPGTAAEAVANYLLELGSPGLVTEEHDGFACLVAYFESEVSLEAIRRYLSHFTLDRVSTVTTRWIGTEDWVENWKVYFDPMPVGARLYVCPPWAAAPPPGRIPIVINPAMAFGTGHHATTRGCLVLLERYGPTPCGPVLDVGTGSGILAIAAARLGATHVVGVDPDPWAREAALDNARRNRVAERVAVVAEIDEVPEETFPLILANLQLRILTDLEAKLAARAAGNSVLIASGLLLEDAPSFLAAYGGRWLPVERLDEDEWASLVLRRRP